jgi:signal transduction histidine kinase
MDRDTELASTFVALSEMLIGEYDAEEFLQELVDRCSRLVDAAAVGVMMVDHTGDLRLSAASTGGMAELEVFEIQRQEGPCYDAYRSGEQVQHPDLKRSADRWPRFAGPARGCGYRAVHAFPLRVREQRLGALNVFFRRTGPFTDADLQALQSLADVAAIGVAQQHSTSRRRSSRQRALMELSRIALQPAPLARIHEQVCGTVAAMLDVPACQIHELHPTGRLVPRGGVGRTFAPEPSGRREDSPHRLALAQRRSVVIEDLGTDDRFRDEGLSAHGVVSGVITLVPGELEPFGTLSVLAEQPRVFDQEDVDFLETVATLLGSVIARHTVETRLRRAERLEAVGELATGIAHDFGNLLVVMHGNAQLLAADRASPELDAVLTASDQAHRLISRLMDISRQERPELASVDLNAIVTATLAMVEPMIGATIDLDIDLADDLPMVAADASQLEQAIINLVINARDAMPSGGRITVRTREQPVAQIARGGRPMVRLVVADDGAGMTDGVLARAFDPFFSTKGLDQGTGLGLPGVHRAVAAVGGHIDVDSTPGHGTSFVIDLPTVEGALPTSDEGMRAGG